MNQAQAVDPSQAQARFIGRWFHAIGSLTSVGMDRPGPGINATIIDMDHFTIGTRREVLAARQADDEDEPAPRKPPSTVMPMPRLG